MKAKMIKLLFTIACLLCSIQMLAYDFQVDGICYELSDSDNSVCYVTYKDYVNGRYNGNNKYEGMIIIPEKVVYQDKTYKVNSIGDRAFENCDELTDIVITEGITSIGFRAFFGCLSLYSVIVPNSVKSIGGSAFDLCNLQSVVIGSGVTYVANLFGTFSRPAKMIWLPNTPPDGYSGCI